MGFTLIGLDGAASTQVADLPPAEDGVVLVIGSEDAGLSRLVRDTCHELVAIPIGPAVESLSRVAAGIGPIRAGPDELTWAS